MKKERVIISLFLLIIGGLTTFDIIEDISEGVSFSHVALEVLIAVSSILAIFYLIHKYLKDKKLIEVMEKEKIVLKEIALSLEQKSKAFLEGLSVQINDEFISWNLTPAERDVALLLLKGLSPKDISEIRKSSEKTVRHQIQSIYKKGNFNNREELSSHFLEDLLPPSTSL